MSNENKEFDIFWQCPDCGNINQGIANNCLINLSKFKCKHCDKIYALQKKIVQVLCEPVINQMSCVGKTL